MWLDFLPHIQRPSRRSSNTNYLSRMIFSQCKSTSTRIYSQNLIDCHFHASHSSFAEEKMKKFAEVCFRMKSVSEVSQTKCDVSDFHSVVFQMYVINHRR